MQLLTSPAHAQPLLLLASDLGHDSHRHLPGAHLHSGSQLQALAGVAAASSSLPVAEEDDWPVLLGQLAHEQVDPHAHEPSRAQLHDWPGAGATGEDEVDWQHLHERQPCCHTSQARWGPGTAGREGAGQ